MAGLANYVRDKNPEAKSNVHSEEDIKKVKELYMNPQDPLGHLQQQQPAEEILTTHGKAHHELKAERGHEGFHVDTFGTEAGSLDESILDDETPFDQDQRAQTVSSGGPDEADSQTSSEDPALQLQNGQDQYSISVGEQGVPARSHNHYLQHNVTESYPSTTTGPSEADHSTTSEVLQPRAVDDLHAGFKFYANRHRGIPQQHQQGSAAEIALSLTQMPVRGQGRGGIGGILQSSSHATPAGVPLDKTTSSKTQSTATNPVKTTSNMQPSDMAALSMKPSNMRFLGKQPLNLERRDESPPAYEASSNSAAMRPHHSSAITHIGRQFDTQDPPDVFYEGSGVRTRTWRAEPLQTSGDGQTRSPPPEQHSQPSRVSVRPKKDKKRRVTVEQVTAASPEQQQQQPNIQSPPERRLDYEPDELMKLDYSTLRDQPFDFSPTENHDPYSPEEFEELMSKHFNSSPAEQSKFFATMRIDEWEDAGDWLLCRATDIMKRMKTARREKRKLTLEIEMEIEERHDAVVRKRKLTDEVLGAMKRSGGQVLASTPRKRGPGEKA